MAAFNNVPLEQTLKAIQLGLVGNSRGLRAYGVELNAAAVNEEALVESGKANTAELTRQDRVQARIAILFRQTVNQQGAAADRAKDLAGQTRILSAEITNLGAELGKMAFGPAVAAVGAINDLVTAASHLRSVADLVTGGQKSAAHGFSISALAARAYQEELRFLVSPLGDFQRGLNAALGLLIKTPSETATAQEAWVSLRLSIKAFNEEIAAMLAQTGKINFARATAELGKLQDKFLDLQFKGASPSARIANLQAQLQEQLSIIANPPTVKAKTTAKEQRNAIQNQINQILDDQKRAAEDTAQKAQDVASSIAQIAQDAKDKVQELLAEADQAFLDALSVREGAFDIRQAKVEATKSLVDDIAFQQDLERFLKASIVKASTISDAKKKADTIQQLTLALVQAQNAEKALIAAQKQAVADRQATKIANQGASIDLDIEFAQTTKNISAEKRAHEAKIKFLTDQENHAKRGTNEWKQLRNQIAQENAAIAELNKQVNDRNNAAKSLAFDMLVTQEGFAANLISNLIPGGATAGLVGGGAISTPTVAGSGGPSRPPDVGAELGAAVQTSGGPQPATSGQLGALLDIQRRQLAVLEQLFGRTGHPEATAQKAGAAAAMNTVPW